MFVSSWVFQLLVIAGTCKKTQMIILSAWSTLGWDQWPITVTHPAGWVTMWLYIYPTNWNMQDHFSICQWCPPNLVDRKQFLAICPHTGTLYWSTGWESNPWPKTHNLGPGPLGQGNCWHMQCLSHPYQNYLIIIIIIIRVWFRLIQIPTIVIFFRCTKMIQQMKWLFCYWKCIIMIKSKICNEKSGCMA
jgi:hypothetical protein